MSGPLLVQGETRSREALLAEADEASARSFASMDAGSGVWVYHELRALRLTLAAATAPDAEDAPAEPRWCRVELFGHTVVYGIISETLVAGRRFLEVLEPEIVEVKDGFEEVVRAERRKRYHPNAVYALEEIEKDAGFDSLRSRAGLHRWRDGTWRTDREVFSVELNLDALRDRDPGDETSEEDERDGDDIPF